MLRCPGPLGGFLFKIEECFYYPFRGLKIDIAPALSTIETTSILEQSPIK